MLEMNAFKNADQTASLLDGVSAQLPQETVPGGLGGEASPQSDFQGRENAEGSINADDSTDGARAPLVDAPLLKQESEKTYAELGAVGDELDLCPFGEDTRQSFEDAELGRSRLQREGSYVLLEDDETTGHGRQLAR